MKRLAYLVVLLFAMGVSGWAAKLEVIDETGDRAQRINLVFLAEGYTEAQLQDFTADVSRAVGFLLGREPWSRYRSYCNVYGIAVASAQSGADNGLAGGSRDTYFEAGFNTPGVSQLATVSTLGQSRAYALLNQLLPEYDIAVILVNDAKYGGSGGPIPVVTVHASSGGILEHELGHSFAGLADEYAVDYPGYAPREMPNTTSRTNRDQIVWRHWIDQAVPVPTVPPTNGNETVGLYEGSMYRALGWYRPHPDSLMRHLFKPCGAVNREQFVRSIYGRVGPIDSAFPATRALFLDASETVALSVSTLVPNEGDPLATSWTINGTSRPDATGGSLTLYASELGPGLHTIRFTAHDPTGMVRSDPAGLLSDSVAWTVSVVGEFPSSLADWRLRFGPDDVVLSEDGLNNLMKYALGLDPGTPATPAQRPFSSLTAGDGSDRYLVLNVPRTAVRTDIDYVAEVSGDLGIWASGTSHTVTLQNDAARLVIRDAEPISAHPTRFIRLRIVPR